MPEIGLEDSEPEEEQWEPLNCDAPEIDPLTEGIDEGALDAHLMQELVGVVAPVVKKSDKAVQYTYTEERVNVAWATAVSELEVCKKQMLGDQSWSEILHIFCRRARRVNQGVGVIKVAWWESEGVGLSGRRYSGIRGKLPSDLNAEERQAPAGYCCLSAFALPRALKCHLGL
jgi:hypothetical protein